MARLLICVVICCLSGSAVSVGPTQHPRELKGLVTTTSGENVNRCVPDPGDQLGSLRDHGDILGFNMGAGFPDPEDKKYHWQGIQRLPIGTGRVFAVSSSAAPKKGGHLAIVTFGSRSLAGGRLRSNRIPVGFRYRLWTDINRSGPFMDLGGTGKRESYQWDNGSGFSSGCFHNGVRCL